MKNKLIFYVNELLLIKDKVINTTCINTHMIITCSVDNDKVYLNNINKEKSEYILKYIDSIKDKKIFLKYYDNKNNIIEKKGDKAYKIIEKIILCRKIKTLISKIYEIIICVIFHKKYNTRLVESDYDSEDILIDDIPYDLKCVQLTNDNFDLNKLDNEDIEEQKKLISYLIDNMQNDNEKENLFYIVCISNTNNKQNTYIRLKDFNYNKDIFKKVKDNNSLYNHFFTMKNGHINVFMFVFIVK